jgi:hypothetical protein
MGEYALVSASSPGFPCHDVHNSGQNVVDFSLIVARDCGQIDKSNEEMNRPSRTAWTVGHQAGRKQVVKLSPLRGLAVEGVVARETGIVPDLSEDSEDTGHFVRPHIG